MAMLNVQQNIAVELQSLAIEVIEHKNRMAVLISMWNAESMNTLTDADWAALPEFAHVTAAEATAAKNAIDTINTAIGEYLAGTPITKLMRVVNVVPRG